MKITIKHNPSDVVKVGDNIRVCEGVEIRVTEVYELSKCMVVLGKIDANYNKVEVEGDLIIDIR